MNESEAPTTRYLYSDLPSGSVTASVTVAGEPSKADATSIVRREYAPFGLELTSEELASSQTDGANVPSVFHGKELDRVTNFSSFGARYYSRDLGGWLTPDPMLTNYFVGAPNGGVYAPSNVSSYAFAQQCPTTAVDPDGRWVHIAIGAAVGAVGFGGYELYHQLSTAGKVTSWSRVAAFTAGGAGAGALTAATLGAYGIVGGGAATAEIATTAPAAATVVTAAASSPVVEQEAEEVLSVAAEMAPRVPELGNKLSYFLGEATGSLHNIQRSTSMASQLARIGLWNNAETRTYLTEHLTEVLNDVTSISSIQSNGRFVSESLLAGPGGLLKWETVWEGNKLITGQLFGGP